VGEVHKRGQKGGPSGVARTAEESGQTANVDLCFVPATHDAQQRLPAVSGSSGRLVVTPVRETDEEHTWPGQIFEDPSVAYAEAMDAFVAASTAPPLPRTPEQWEAQEEQQARKEEQRLHHHAEMALRAERSAQRAQRRQEDTAWRDLCAARQTAPSGQGGPADPAAEAAWRAQRAQRRATLERRQQDDACWRQQRLTLLGSQLPAPAARRWIAVLVLTDNCTRQCVGLPLFAAGAKVTAEMVRDALRTLLPPELQYLISDRGTHFTAHTLARLAREADFVHVLIARHRPESNGIAERFVRTLKEWLAGQTWESADALAALLAQFRAEYNERPHQGLGIPGLSPTEFAQRIWLL